MTSTISPCTVSATTVRAPARTAASRSSASRLEAGAAAVPSTAVSRCSGAPQIAARSAAHSAASRAESEPSTPTTIGRSSTVVSALSITYPLAHEEVLDTAVWGCGHGPSVPDAQYHLRRTGSADQPAQLLAGVGHLDNVREERRGEPGHRRGQQDPLQCLSHPYLRGRAAEVRAQHGDHGLGFEVLAGYPVHSRAR